MCIFHCSVVRVRKPGIMKGRIWLFGQSPRRGGRAVECGGLENRFTRNPGNEGSNPSSSASNPAGSETGLLLFCPGNAGKGFPTPLKQSFSHAGACPHMQAGQNAQSRSPARGPIRPPCHPASPIRLRSPLQDNPEPARRRKEAAPQGRLLSIDPYESGSYRVAILIRTEWTR